MIDTNVHDDEGYMTDIGTDVQLLSRLSQGVHVRYESDPSRSNASDGQHCCAESEKREDSDTERDGRTCTGMVLDSPLPTSDGVCVRIRSDHNRDVVQIPYQQITQIER